MKLEPKKYALIKMRSIGMEIELDRQRCDICGQKEEGHNDALGPDDEPHHWEKPTLLTIPFEFIDFGEGGDQFFVIRLKDKFAPGALRGYYDAIREFAGDNPSLTPEERAGWIEYGKEILNLLELSTYMERKLPD